MDLELQLLKKVKQYLEALGYPSDIETNKPICLLCPDKKLEKE